MNSAVDVDGRAEAGFLSLFELFAGHLAIDADTDHVCGGNPGLLKRAYSAENAVVVASIDKEALSLRYADDGLRRCR